MAAVGLFSVIIQSLQYSLSELTEIRLTENTYKTKRRALKSGLKTNINSNTTTRVTESSEKSQSIQTRGKQ